MSVTFEIAPLIEIVAELRWGNLPQQSANIQAGGAVLYQPTNLDEFFMRFSGEVFQHNFKKSERLVPSGFPMLAYQPAYRFRKESQSADDGSILYQVGYGMFSANAIQPYRSWAEFSPYVTKGVDALIASRVEAEQNAPFTAINLRYIDAFNEYLTQGMDIETFAKETLGISLNLPSSITSLIQSEKKVKPNIQLIVPIDDSTSMNILLAEANVNNELVIMLDCTVSTTRLINPNTAEVMEIFVNSRKIIHEMFVSLTEKITHLMKPLGAN